MQEIELNDIQFVKWEKDFIARELKGSKGRFDVIKSMLVTKRGDEYDGVIAAVRK